MHVVIRDSLGQYAERYVLDRLADKFTVGDGCWEWTAGKYPEGYGSFWLNGRTRQAHRVLYELMIGSIPVGLHLDHLCRNRSCVRPAHLEPVTPRENLRRGPRAFGRFHLEKSHCPQGHPYDGPNLRITADGWRSCRACKKEYDRKRRSRCTLS